MSLVVSLVFGFIGFLLSIYGLFVFLLGILAFVALPVIPAAMGEFRKLADVHLWLGSRMLGRIAVVVSEHDDLLLKRMRFDDLGVEKISFGSDTKDFEDPDNALHYFSAARFAIADELHGVLFDPRHAAAGDRRDTHRQRDEWERPATTHEWDKFNAQEFKRAVFEFPRRVNEIVSLSSVRHLVDGGERAEYPERVEEYYKNSRDPLLEGTSPTQFILIIVAAVGPFAAMWVMATQVSGSGGGGSTVGYGLGSALLFWGPPAALYTRVTDRVRESVAKVKHTLFGSDDSGNRLQPASDNTGPTSSSGSDGSDGSGGVDWLYLAKLLALVVPVPVLFVLVAAVVNPVLAVIAFGTLGMGFLFVPVLTFVFGASARLSGLVGPLLFRTGLKGYRRPVFEWTRSKYRLRDYDELENTAPEPSWYGLAGSIVGFTFEPSPASWGPEHIDNDELESRKEKLPESQRSPQDSNLPVGTTRLPSIRRAGNLVGFAPARTDRDSYYLHTGITMSRFTDSADGNKSHQRLTFAKDEHGESDGISDTRIAYMILACALVSTGLGVFVFFL